MESERIEIAIDARAYRSGLGVYTSNLVRELHDTHKFSIHALAHRQRAPWLASYCTRISIIDAPMYSVKEQITVSRSVRNDKILHVPHYNAPLLYKGRLLLTIHDLTHLLYSGYARRWKQRLYAELFLKVGACRAHHIFTVSAYSKLQIVERLRINPECVSVIYNGVGPEFHPADRKQAQTMVATRFGLHAPFLLYVGNLKPHKNVQALLRAFAELPSGLRREYVLVLVGSDQSGMQNLLPLAASLHITPHFISDATNSEIASLYQAAEVLVMPSFEEGFGLPVVEAMACGTPVICSEGGSLPEVAGDAALYFNPDDHHQLSDQLLNVLQSPSLQDALRSRGLVRATRFTWKQSVKEHVQVYRQVCG